MNKSNNFVHYIMRTRKDKKRFKKTRRGGGFLLNTEKKIWKSC